MNYALDMAHGLNTARGKVITHLADASKKRGIRCNRWHTPFISTTDDVTLVTCKGCLGTRAPARHAAVSPAGTVKPGDIFYDSWGYNMTIVDFYKVVRLTPRGAEFVAIGQKETATGYLCGTTMPDPSVTGTGHGVLKAFKWGTTGEDVSFSGTMRDIYGVDRGDRKVYLTRWDGSPRYFNHCD